jgi:hypothetical protein
MPYAPDLVQPVASNDRWSVGGVRETSGMCLDGDAFLLMTDALSRWFLRQVEAGRSPWTLLQEGAGDGGADFPAWVADKWARDELELDDITFISVAVGSTT